jgi:Domain of unknown function (DUF2470)
MDFDVLPGPSLPELARTALARAAAATVSDASPSGRPAAAGQVPVRATWDGRPVLLPASGSWLEQRLSARRSKPVTVSVPADAPFSAVRLTGTSQWLTRDRPAGITACVVAVQSVEFTGSGHPRVPLDEYQAAAPDPLWRVATSILRHLERGHMGELVHCVRAHGMPQADWVIPRGLDRYGLQLLVLTTDGAAAVRLAFPGGPVTSLDEVPASIRTALTCRCQAETEHHQHLRRPVSELTASAPGPGSGRRPRFPRRGRARPRS